MLQLVQLSDLCSMITPLSIYREIAIVLIKANIPKIRIASRKAFVLSTIDTIAIIDIKFTPIISNATALSGMEGPLIIRKSAIPIEIANNESDNTSIFSTI